MKGIGPFSTRKDAEAAEKAVAEALEREGIGCFGVRRKENRVRFTRSLSSSRS
jgi:hypothetical protein